MLLESPFFTTAGILFYSLIFLCLIFLEIKRKRFSKNKVKKFLTISLSLTIVILLFSVFYWEKKIGGECVFHYHGLPHYYLVSSKCFGDEEELKKLWSSEDLFLEKNFSKILSGFGPHQFVADFMFWSSLLLLLSLIISKEQK